MATTAIVEMNDVAAALEATTLDDVTSRHRKEKKDLQAKIQALKKNAPKVSDKKKRKEVMEEVARMESEMEQRHESELKVVQQRLPENGQLLAEETEDQPPSAEDNLNSKQRVSKAQKRRDKKAAEARQREEEIRTAAEEAQYAPKAIEASQLQAKLKERALALHQIHSDGDCLYNAVRHQLILHGLGTFSVQQLRTETANYIRAHKEALHCFLVSDRTGDPLNDEEFENYCEAVCNTPAWGGQIELKALSSVLKVPIEVLQAEGPPTLQGTEEFAGPPLVLVYHRHLYSLGEHYDSTVPPSMGNDEAE